MKIATFNINGIKARLPALLDWLDEAKPDVAMLQEIKSVDEGVPHDPFTERGYQIETHGQKGFNGVAILSRLPLEDISRGLPGDEEDVQARWIEATVMGTRAIRICGLYLPNGNPAPGPKYDYKLAWLKRMEAHVIAMMQTEEPMIFAGDYNIIPQPEDAATPSEWTDDALFLPATRDAWRRLLALGLTDAFRAVHPHRPPAPGPEHFSFWDYQAGSWNRNNGIRIDHLLLSPQAADLLEDAQIDSAIRGREKPSDHVPVWITLDA